MIEEGLYQTYLNALLNGRRKECQDMVHQLLKAKVEIKELYTDLFRRSLYTVGELWENNRITVANEHLATAMNSPRSFQRLWGPLKYFHPLILNLIALQSGVVSDEDVFIGERKKLSSKPHSKPYPLDEFYLKGISYNYFLRW